MAEVVAVLQDLPPDLRAIEMSERNLSGRASRMDVIRIEKDVGFVAQFDLATGLGDYLTWREATGLTTKPVKPAPGPPRTFRIWPFGKFSTVRIWKSSGRE